MFNLTEKEVVRVLVVLCSRAWSRVSAVTAAMYVRRFYSLQLIDAPRRDRFLNWVSGGCVQVDEFVDSELELL